MLSFIPFVLLSGPLGGYLLGDYLSRSLHLRQAVQVCVISGLLAGIYEAVRILRLVIRISKG